MNPAPRGPSHSHVALFACAALLSGCGAAADALGSVVAVVMVFTIALIQLGALLVQFVRFVASQPRGEEDVHRDPSAPSILAILLIILSATVHWLGMVPFLWSHPASTLPLVTLLYVAASLAHAFVVTLGLPAPKADFETGRQRRSLRGAFGLVMTIVAFTPLVVRLATR